MISNEALIEYVETKVLLPGFEEKTLRWAGIGCQLEISKPDGVSVCSAFSLERLDKHPFYKDYESPQVIRIDNGSLDDKVEDLVAYGHTVEDLPERVGTFLIPRNIDNFYAFSYGEWLRPDAVLTHEGSFFFSAMKLAIERGEGEEQRIADWTYKNIGSVSLAEMGTAPFYPLAQGLYKIESL